LGFICRKEAFEFYNSEAFCCFGPGHPGISMILKDVGLLSMKQVGKWHRLCHLTFFKYHDHFTVPGS